MTLSLSMLLLIAAFKAGMVDRENGAVTLDVNVQLTLVYDFGICYHGDCKKVSRSHL